MKYQWKQKSSLWFQLTGNTKQQPSSPKLQGKIHSLHYILSLFKLEAAFLISAVTIHTIAQTLGRMFKETVLLCNEVVIPTHEN